MFTYTSYYLSIIRVSVARLLKIKVQRKEEVNVKKIFIAIVFGAFIFAGCQSTDKPKEESSSKIEQKVPASAEGKDSTAKSAPGKKVTQEEANQIALEQISTQHGAGEIKKSELKDGVYKIEIIQGEIKYLISIEEKTGETLDARIEMKSE